MYSSSDPPHAQIVLWDTVSGGAVAHTLLGHHGVVYTVAWAADGTQLASAGDDRAVRLWRVRSCDGWAGKLGVVRVSAPAAGSLPT